VNIVERVDEWVTIRNVLVSVSDKTGLEVLIPGLIDVSPDVRFYSTGGTFKAMTRILGPARSARHLIQVSDYTGQPETQGGLVKTLDFKIYLGLLTETYNGAHQADLERAGAVPIDMVLVNLYPFEATVAHDDATVEVARAHIDIGGPCMIRAAAKNYLRVAPVVDPADYASLLASLQTHSGRLSLVDRFQLARKAFAHTAAYEKAISEYLALQEPQIVPTTYSLEQRHVEDD